MKTPREKFTVVHILENCANTIKYSMLSTVFTAIIGNVAGVHKFFKNPVINREQWNRAVIFRQ